MSDTDNPELEPVLDESQDTEEVVDDESLQAEDETDAETEAEAEDDSEEVEYEGKQYKLPKELKEALLRQADYTRKTQEVAEQRRAIEAQVQQQQQLLEVRAQTIEGRAYLASIDQNLAQYNQINWSQLAQDDPAEANRLWIQRSQLVEQRQGVSNHLAQMEQHALETQQQETVRRLQEGTAILQRDIPGWSAQKASELQNYAVKELGIPQAIVAQIDDPAVVKAINRLFMLEKQAAKPKPQPKPATVIKSQSGNAKVDPMKLSADEWARRRNADLAKRNKR